MNTSFYSYVSKFCVSLRARLGVFVYHYMLQHRQECVFQVQDWVPSRRLAVFLLKLHFRNIVFTYLFTTCTIIDWYHWPRAPLVYVFFLTWWITCPRLCHASVSVVCVRSPSKAQGKEAQHTFISHGDLVVFRDTYMLPPPKAHAEDRRPKAVLVILQKYWLLKNQVQ